MKPSTKQLAIVVLATLVGVVAIPTTSAAVGARLAPTRPAGPWYTPRELRALIRYSNASFAQKKALLAGSGATASEAGGSLAPAGPWYTPHELEALVAYGKASFERKKALLAGSRASTPTEGATFHWRDASIGAGFAMVSVLLAGAVLWLARARRQRWLGARGA